MGDWEYQVVPLVGRALMLAYSPSRNLVGSWALTAAPSEHELVTAAVQARIDAEARAGAELLTAINERLNQQRSPSCCKPS